MKKIGFIVLFVLSLQILQAQPEDKKIGKITFLMVDGKYEDAAGKAEKLRQDPEYRKNAWVYYYLAQSNFEIAAKPELTEDYPKAFKESLKAASKLYKYRNKPEENYEVYEDAEEFLMVLKDSAIIVSEIYIDNDNPRKAAYYLSRVVKFDPEDYGVLLMKGVYELKSRNVGEGIKSILSALDSLRAGDYVPDEVSAFTLVDALDEFALILKSGEYDKYFTAYKYNPTQKDIDEVLAFADKFEKYLEGEEVDKEERKKESETIYKTFRSDDEEEDDEE